LFVYPDKASYFEFRRTVPKLCLDKTTVKEYDGLDFDDKDCFAVFPFEAVFQIIYYDIETAFQRTVDLKKKLFVRIRMIKHKLFINRFLKLLKRS